ncbi:MAG: DUF3108 domain-containing protein [Alphaproteobacteria bacterium]|nr:DUF3108 domain-containing protein [Alphaproteobacteria bacterium]
MKKILLNTLFLLLTINTSHSAEVEHHFKVNLGTFDAAEAKFSYSLSPHTYSVNSIISTSGLFHTLYPFQAKYSTSGKIKKDQLQTTDYHYSSQSRFNSRSKELIYNEDGIPIYQINTKNNKSKKRKIENSQHHKGTTDLQTVFAALTKQYNELKFCDSRMEVFDGKRRFDVIFKDEGQEYISACANGAFSGKASKCSMYIDKLNSDEDDLLWQLTSERPVYFWILEDTATKKPFIAQIKVKDTPLGKLNVCTDKITIKE